MADKIKKLIKDSLLACILGIALAVGGAFVVYLSCSVDLTLIVEFIGIILILAGLFCLYAGISDGIDGLRGGNEKALQDLEKENLEKKNRLEDLVTRYKDTLHVFSWNDEASDNIRSILFFDEPQILQILGDDEIKYADIVSIDCEYIQEKNGQSYKSSVSTGSLVGRALIGGAIGGAVGACIGGATANRTYTKLDSSQRVVLHICLKNGNSDFVGFQTHGTKVFECDTKNYKPSEYIVPCSFDEFFNKIEAKLADIIKTNKQQQEV
jgi:hypothetical protein